MSSLPTSSSSSDASLPTPFDALAALQCRVSIVLGTGTISVRQCLSLERHTVLRLNQAAGEDLSVSVHGITIAKGEVAIIDTSAAIRVTDLSPSPASARRSA
jgi:flagellar motor switch/type III secretory pathway protein FliN